MVSKSAALEPNDDNTSLGDSGHGLVKSLMTVFVSLYFLHKMYVTNVAMPISNNTATITKTINRMNIKSRELSEILPALTGDVCCVVDPVPIVVVPIEIEKLKTADMTNYVLVLLRACMYTASVDPPV